MADIQEIRDWLAEKAMGWEKDYHSWMSNEGWEASIGNWRPDQNWQQCGMVIEAMREKGWRWDVQEHVDGHYCVALRRGPGEFAAIHGTAEERYTRMLAAARALGYSDD